MSATKPPPGYDDRFVVPLEPSRRGAHRARVSPVIGALPVVAVVAVVLVVAVMAWVLFGPTSDDPSTSTVATSPVATGSVTPGPTGQPTPTTPSDTVSAPATPLATAAQDTVDKTIGVTVLNSTKRNGLARKVSTTLTGKGWVAARFATTSTAARTTTTAFYATTAQKAAAEAIIADLGVGTIKKSTSFGTAGITVVVGSDYP
jgi:hypothetical protein